MEEPTRFVLRVNYKKTGRLRHLGHLDLLRAQERSIRRASLPFCLTQGYSPRMKCAYSAALPVGAASEHEYFDLSLSSYLEPEEALARLQRSTPQDLAPIAAAYVDPHSPALGAWLDRSRWQLDLATQASAHALAEALTALAEKGQLTYLRGRKEKKVDLTSTLVGWTVEPRQPGWLRVVVDTRSSNEGALRPEVLVRAAFDDAALAGETLEACHVERLGQWHEEKDGSLVKTL